MTREEAIAYFKDMNECTYGNVEPIQMAIKALEQKPIDVLDKIRSEIEQERVGYPPSADYYKAIMKCLQIIDKCKAEKE